MKRLLRTPLVALLTWEARLALMLHRPQIVAITGNMGKTTTKDAIYAVISPHLHARKSAKSFNSDIGVPLAILGLDNPWLNPIAWIVTLAKGLASALMPGFPKLLVLEVGADAPGDIRSIASWLSPDIAVYTGVPKIPVHIVQFGSRDELVAEKRSLLQRVPQSGVVILNGDEIPEEARDGVRAPVRSYGFGECDFRASHLRTLETDGLPESVSFEIEHHADRAEAIVHGSIGRPRVYAALAACAVADALGIALKDAADALAAWKPPAGRMRVLGGKQGSIILDDSYNASPAAVLSALDTLAELAAERKIAVLGDMRELGEKSIEAHRDVGQAAAKVVDMLITVGEESKALAQAAIESGLPADHVRQYGYDTSEQVGKDLAMQLRAGDVVLVKGSQNRIRLERCVYQLLADTTHAENQLVRHETAWRKRS